MAKKKRSSVNKSKAIRDYLAKNPNAKPLEVAEALGKKNIKVTAAVVSSVKYQMGKTKKRRPKKAAKKVATPSKNGNVALSDLLAAKEYADKVGGVKTAQEMLKALEMLGAN